MRREKKKQVEKQQRQMERGAGGVEAGREDETHIDR